MRQGTLVVNGLLACLVLVVGTGHRAYGQKGRNEVGEGNRQFEKGKFEEARASYRKALGKAPGSPVATFNLGGSQYKLKEFSDAEESFMEAAQSSDSEVLGRAHYNLGNSLFRQGRVEESVEAFKQALRLNPNDHQAKHNLEFVLTQQQQQEQQQQPQQDQTSEKDREDQQEKNQQQEQEPQDQPSEDEGNQDQEGEEQEQSEETSAQQGARPEDENQEEPDQTPENQSQPQSKDENTEQAAQPQPGRLTREEASRLLEAIQEDLQSLRREQLKKLKQTRVEKDW